jgi:RimJ/RimL family protein N-acetyltransferase
VTLDSLQFRKISRRDDYTLWIWANDAETRRASAGRQPISWSQHVEWLKARTDDPSAFLLIAEAADGQPVGSIRFDTQDDWRTARLSYVVAPEARGMGFSRKLVTAGITWLRKVHPEVAIRAEVDHANPKSLRVFRGEGWAEELVRPGVSCFWLWHNGTRRDDPD